MIKIPCKKCGAVNMSYSPPRFCQHCHAIFDQVHNEQTKKPRPVQPAGVKPEPVKTEQTKKPVNEQTKNFKKPLTEKQKKFYKKMSDTLQRVKSDQVCHILDKIQTGYYTVSEFLNDPEVYFDSRIMGNHLKNSILKKQIKKAIEQTIYGGIAVN